MTNFELASKFILQLFFIMGTTQVFRYVGKNYFKQPEVICEMVAGIVLGPSILGLIFPNFQNWLFPSTALYLDQKPISNPSMSILFAVSQLGLILYMFIVGMKFNLKAIKTRFKLSLFIAAVGIVVPFSLGMTFSFYLPSHLNLFSDNLSPLTKGFFLGTALSITAFPMLARILEENNISKTHFGTLVLSAGALGDALAWVLLAALLAIINGNLQILWLAILGISSYVFILYCCKIIAPNTLYNNNSLHNSKFTTKLVLLLMLLFLGSYFTEIMGINFVFGAFLFGIIIPRGNLNQKIISNIKVLTKTLLLPVFFVYSGINTQINLINSFELILVTLIITFIAIFGKGFFCMIAARFLSESWKSSILVGVLMNARGLIELIILNIGLQHKIISPTLFSILILMTIITTMMTAPLFYYVNNKIPGKIN